MEERSSLPRLLLFAVAVFLFVTYGLPAITGKSTKSDVQPLGRADDTTPAVAARPAEELCTLAGARFQATLTSRGGSLQSYLPADGKYLERQGGHSSDLVTTTLASRLPLRTDLRLPPAGAGAPEQLAFDDVDWKLESKTATGCVFRYEDESTSATKTIATTERPFELELTLAVTNKAKEARAHRLTVENAEFYRAADTKSSWQRQSEYQTQVEVHAGDNMVRWGLEDFEPKDFEDADFSAEKWRVSKGDAALVAVSTSYFAKVLVPLEGAKPRGETLVEEIWNRAQFADKDKDPQLGHTYRARLGYEPRILAAGETATYRVLSFTGPKEREVLAGIGGGGYPTTEVLNLGTFGAIGKWLIRYLYFLHGLVASWGWAICLLTITVKVLLFPLSIAQIKSTVAMRKLKPEMDAINAKYKDDAQQRGLALQELWRKNQVANPMLGCLPVLLQMPVWWALYTSLQTAVELYHTPFGPFVPDLSAPGKYFIIPAMLGVSSFLQQHLMPMQGDPMQQRMMKWMMPSMFTVMMLFLPAGLGIYFLTNTWLGILQQVAVERFYKTQESPSEPTPA
ncbi:MAG: YidC/Oxa1 family insertase periplasmic-domain containing protein [Deltaproteobacteria bacterium]|nr:YidC/Oxa1 family insertase periplasmic-domain containing protein [Deltaproteobacteria bacterium]